MLLGFSSSALSHVFPLCCFLHLSPCKFCLYYFPLSLPCCVFCLFVSLFSPALLSCLLPINLPRSPLDCFFSSLVLFPLYIIFPSSSFPVSLVSIFECFVFLFYFAFPQSSSLFLFMYLSEFLRRIPWMLLTDPVGVRHVRFASALLVSSAVSRKLSC